jgi:uncharacterized protein (DUF342 family)
MQQKPAFLLIGYRLLKLLCVCAILFLMGNDSTILSNSRDARMMVSFSDNDLIAHADFIPAAASGQALSMGYVTSLLERLGVTYGVLGGNIKEAVGRCNAGETLSAVVIARGERPVSESPACFQLDDRLREPPKPAFDDAENADYRAWSPFVIVQKGQLLASYRPPVDGRNGVTVHGQPLPFQTLARRALTIGKNTEQTPEGIVARAAGLLTLAHGTLNVETTLLVRGSVG